MDSSNSELVLLLFWLLIEICLSDLWKVSFSLGLRYKGLSVTLLSTLSRSSYRFDP